MAPWRNPALAITRHADDVQAAFRRMVFNVLACNRDEHGQWRLAPAYDLTYSAGPGGEHYLDIEGEGRNPTRKHVQALGRRHGLSDRVIDTVVEEVRASVAEWGRFATEAGVTSRSRGNILAAQDSVAGHFL